jgi:hypothetical protein
MQQGVCARIERRSSKKGARPNARCSATTIDDGGDGAAAARKVHCGVTLMGLQAAAAALTVPPLADDFGRLH